MKLFPDEKLGLIFKLNREGVPVKEIAAQIGLDASTVRRHMKANGFANPVGKARKKATA